MNSVVIGKEGDKNNIYNIYANGNNSSADAIKNNIFNITLNNDRSLINADIYNIYVVTGKTYKISEDNILNITAGNINGNITGIHIDGTGMLWALIV